MTNADNHKGHWYRLVAYVAIVLVVAGALYASKVNTLDAIKQNQIEACERGNVLRAQANINVDVLSDFLLTAENTRRLLAKDALAQTPPDQSLAAINLAAAQKYEDQRTQLVPIPSVDCKAVIR